MRKRRFVVLYKLFGYQSSIPRSVLDKLTEKWGCGWWMRLPGSLLVTSNSEDISAAGLREILYEGCGGGHFMVVEAHHGSWASRLPKGYTEWMYTYWPDEPTTPPENA